MSKILRIHTGGQANQEGWYKSRKISHDDINSIQDGTSTGGKFSLNSVPSPLARIHLFETAFTLVEKFERSGGKEINDVYHKLVSDCFDVLELLFNWQSHLQSGANLSIDVWDVDYEIALLKNSIIKEHELVGITLEMFFKQDFPKIKSIYIFKYDGVPFAGTSPLTIAFTTPNSLDNFNLKNPSNDGQPYFKQIRPLNSRSESFRTFIYTEVSQQPNFESVKRYLDNKKFSIPTKTLDINSTGIVTDTGIHIQVNGFYLKQSNSSSFNPIKSKILLKSPSTPKNLSGRLPIIFSPYKNSFGDPQRGISLPEIISNDISQRILVDNGVKYPWLYVNDFLED